MLHDWTAVNVEGGNEDELDMTLGRVAGIL
jgi:hypothetical protein